TNPALSDASASPHDRIGFRRTHASDLLHPHCAGIPVDRYPILPQDAATYEYTRQEILHIRHHSLFAPRDFDLSPFFQIVKPGLEADIDHKALVSADAVGLGPLEPAGRENQRRWASGAGTRRPRVG